MPFYFHNRTAVFRFHPWSGSDQTRDDHRLDWATMGPDHTLAQAQWVRYLVGSAFCSRKVAFGADCERILGAEYEPLTDGS